MLSALVPLAPTLLMKRQIAAIALSLLLVAIDLGTYVKLPLIPVNNQNRDRQLSSFSDEECDRELRFTRVEIQAILTELHLPQSFTMDNGLRVDGESAFLYFLYRMHYPNTLAMGQEMWGREYSELDRIYNFMLKPMFSRRNGNLQDWMLEKNSIASAGRVSNEWDFGGVTSTYKFINVPFSRKLLESAVSKQYILAAFLYNCKVCLAGSNCSYHFGLEPPTLRDYLSQYYIS